VEYDPTLYLGAARHYLAGRPPYSAALEATLTAELGLDGTGQLLDVGSGPGVLAVRLAGLFDEIVGLEPDAEMLADAAGRADEAGVDNVRWVQARAEELGRDGELGLQPASVRLVTFGQSYHWTSGEPVAEVVYDLLVPGGSVVLAVHHRDRPVPDGPDVPGEPPPLIPHDEIHALIHSYLGDEQSARRGRPPSGPDYQESLGRTRFGPPRTLFAPGRTDLVRDVDSVISNFLSMSFAAPHLFGERLGEFTDDLRALLLRHSPTGRFWDWPGDTEIIIATKPGP
jgi:SAM-dependent methyltransferase